MDNHVHEKLLLNQVRFQLFYLVDILLPLVVPVFVRECKVGKEVLDVATQKYWSLDSFFMERLYGAIIHLVP